MSFIETSRKKKIHIEEEDKKSTLLSEEMVGLIRSGNRFKSCPLKDSDCDDFRLKELKIHAKRRHEAQLLIETSNKVQSDVKQEKSKISTDFYLNKDEADDDVFTIQELRKKRKITSSQNSGTILRDDTEKLKPRKKTSVDTGIDDKYTNLKPLESFVLSSHKSIPPERRKMLIESARMEISDNLNLSEKQNTPLFEDISTSDIIKKVKTETESKYDIPPIVDSNRLLKQCEPVLKVVKYILKGILPSSYYNEAKMLSRQSTKPFFSLHDISMSSLNKFLAGFYGWKRQTIVGERIFHKYKNELTQNTSPVVKWWGAKDFAIYVLAPEVLTLVAILKMKIGSKDFRHRLKHHLKDLNSDDIETLLDYGSEMLDIFEATGEYGTLVTDNEPLESWEVRPSDS